MGIQNSQAICTVASFLVRPAARTASTRPRRTRRSSGHLQRNRVIVISVNWALAPLKILRFGQLDEVDQRVYGDNKKLESWLHTFPNCPSKKKPRGESEPLCDEKMPRASRVHVPRADSHEGIQHVILGAWAARLQRPPIPALLHGRSALN